MSRFQLISVSTLLFIVTAIVRHHQLPQSFLFAEDQEDIALRVKQILVDKQPTLISAKFSQVGIHLGPGYLYFLTPFFLATNFHPYAAILATVFLAGISGTLLFHAGRSSVNFLTGLLTWLLYTFSPLIHQFDRIFWNPNLILPASSLALLSMIKLNQGKTEWIPLLGIAIGLGLQSHPQALILGLIAVVILAALGRKLKLKLKNWLIFIGIIFLAVSPVLAFEIRHNFVISNEILDNIGSKSLDQTNKIISNLNVINNGYANILGIKASTTLYFIFPILIISTLIFFKHSLKKILLLWIASAFFYTLVPYDFRFYYVLFTIPPFLLLFSLTINQTKSTLAGKLSVVLISFLLLSNAIKIFSQREIKNGLKQKLASTNYAVKLIKAQKAKPDVQINMNAEGFHYLIWYSAKVQNIGRPIGFHESWDKPDPNSVVIQSIDNQSQGAKVFGDLEVVIK